MEIKIWQLYTSHTKDPTELSISLLTALTYLIELVISRKNLNHSILLYNRCHSQPSRVYQNPVSSIPSVREALISDSSYSIQTHL